MRRHTTCLSLSGLFHSALYDGSAGKESACNAENVGDMGSVPGWERSPGEGHGNLLQYSCQENPMAGGAWQA